MTVDWLPEASALMEWSIYIRKRKQAFGGQTVDMDAVQQRLAKQRRLKRDR
jgi:hypothetical protein